MGSLFPSCIIVGWFCIVPFSALAHVCKETASVDHESIKIIVTTNVITVGTNFSGRDLYIAGVVENVNPQLRQQNRYDVIVSLEGKARPMTIWEKRRSAGVWVNGNALMFQNVPLFYSMVTTREIRDITSPENYKRLGLGLSYFFLRTSENDREKVKVFRSELIKLQKAKNLYSEEVGGVRFDSGSLFTAYFRLPANIPVGRYHVRAYLFRDGQLIDNMTKTLRIVKAHIAYTIFRNARKHSVLYGFSAVFLAILMGWLGRVIFRKN